MALVLDTGPIYASLDVDDGHHTACLELITGSHETLVIPAPVLPEVDYWCRRRLRSEAFVDVLDDIGRGSYSVEDLRPADYRRAAELCLTHADLGVGFVDAAVLAIVERLRESKLATLDHRHFSAMRPRHVAALELLPA